MIRGVYRSDKIYTGNATALAPDLIIGYRPRLPRLVGHNASAT